MIIDRGWNKYERKLSISYVDKLGNRQLYEKNLHHWRTYEYADDGQYNTWNGKKCNKVYKDSETYRPNEFDILEYMYEMDPQVLSQLKAINNPKIYFFDIETETSNEFPDPTIAAKKVTSISLVGPDMSCLILGLHSMSEESINILRTRYLDWINNNEFAKSKCKRTPKVLYQAFNTEEALLTHWMTNILPKISCLAGWNSYNFDWTYIVNRCNRLFGESATIRMIRNISPTRELTTIRYEQTPSHHENITVPKHMMMVDYMHLVKQYDFILRPYESYSLDWVSEHAVNAHKIKYEGTLQELYERDHEWYYYYNAIDSLLILLIHMRLKCIESPCALSSVTLVPYQAAQGQIAVTTANVFEEFYNDNKHVVWDYDAIPRFKVEYEGAFCGAVPGLYEYTVCDDFASLYPSQIRTCNFSFENFMHKYSDLDDFGRRVELAWTEDELNKFKEDPQYFVSINNHVYKNDKDYAFKKMQTRLAKLRNYYKYTGQDIESELIDEVDKLIKSKE